LFVATTATNDEATPDERAPFRLWSLLFPGLAGGKQKARVFPGPLHLF